jgi:hypothetical protein
MTSSTSGRVVVSPGRRSQKPVMTRMRPCRAADARHSANRPSPGPAGCSTRRGSDQVPDRDG